MTAQALNNVRFTDIDASVLSVTTYAFDVSLSPRGYYFKLVSKLQLIASSLFLDYLQSERFDHCPQGPASIKTIKRFFRI